jgi:hypothetical protein
MKVKADPLTRHRDHLVLIEERIAATAAAIDKNQQNIRRMLCDGEEVATETSALRASTEALKRLQADRLATLNQISRREKT